MGFKPYNFKFKYQRLCSVCAMYRVLSFILDEILVLHFVNKEKSFRAWSSRLTILNADDQSTVGDSTRRTKSTYLTALLSKGNSVSYRSLDLLIVDGVGPPSRKLQV